MPQVGNKIVNSPQPAILYQAKWYTVSAADALAGKYVNRGKFKAAEEICLSILKKAPNHLTALYRLSLIYLQTGRSEEALASCDQALALHPPSVEAYLRRGAVLQALNRYDEALATYDTCVALEASHAQARFLRGLMLKYLRRFDEALINNEIILRNHPNLPEAYCQRGQLLVVKGDMEEGEKMFRKAVALSPNYDEAWAGLIGIRKYQNIDDSDIKAIQAVALKPGIGLIEKQRLLFALGKSHDDCHQFDRAFAYFREANELRKSEFSYDPAATMKMATELIRLFTKEYLAGPSDVASMSSLPLFVVGMPRSGTTLIASMLSNHPLVATAGEVLEVDAFSKRLGRVVAGPRYPEAAKTMPSLTASKFIQDYLEKLNRSATKDVWHIVDKYPLNFWHLGLIARLFPRARIIHCVRHPFDTGLSTYFQPFSLGYSYSAELQNIAHYYNEYRRMMDHWRKVLPPGMMLEINYENMVQETEKTARTALGWLGLDWDKSCLFPQFNRAGIETFSGWQVRQPIYDQAIGRWRHYEKHLGPLLEMIHPRPEC